MGPFIISTQALRDTGPARALALTAITWTVLAPLLFASRFFNSIVASPRGIHVTRTNLVPWDSIIRAERIRDLVHYHAAVDQTGSYITRSLRLTPEFAEAVRRWVRANHALRFAIEHEGRVEANGPHETAAGRLEVREIRPTAKTRLGFAGMTLFFGAIGAVTPYLRPVTAVVLGCVYAAVVLALARWSLESFVASYTMTPERLAFRTLFARGEVAWEDIVRIRCKNWFAAVRFMLTLRDGRIVPVLAYPAPQMPHLAAALLDRCPSADVDGLARFALSDAASGYQDKKWLNPGWP